MPPVCAVPPVELPPAALELPPVPGLPPVGNAPPTVVAPTALVFPPTPESNSPICGSVPEQAATKTNELHKDDDLKRMALSPFFYFEGLTNPSRFSNQ